MAPALEEELDRAVRVLRAGGLVAFPTETVYGLGANAEDPAAVAKIFAAKGRPTTHPLIVHIPGAERLAEWAADVPPAARLLAERFWPGPLTLIVRRAARVPLAVTGGLETVGLRVPAHPVARALLAMFGGGLAAPSANRFGSVSATTAEHVREELGDRVDVILDGGACPVGVESTIVDVTGERPIILRPGGVTREQLEAALGEVEVGKREGVRSPGEHASHYAPRATVYLVAPDAMLAEANRLRAEGKKVGVITPTSLPGAPGVTVVVAPSAPDEYARRIYAILRELDRTCDVILASLPPAEGLGLAIADRLGKAAGPRGKT